MFEHMRPVGAYKFRLHWGALVVALTLMFGVGVALVTGVSELMHALGYFPGPRPPVEVTYTPYDDGLRLEQLLGPEEMPQPLPEFVPWPIQEADPAVSDPAVSDPAVSDPAVSNPAVSNPAVSDPAAAP